MNVDTVGNGEVHHVTAEGFALLYRHDRRLIAACERLGSRALRVAARHRRRRAR